jgi:hypothetical protein
VRWEGSARSPCPTGTYATWSRQDFCRAGRTVATTPGPAGTGSDARVARRARVGAGGRAPEGRIGA